MAINKNKVMEVAQKFVEKGQTDKAIKEYQKILDEDPKDVRIRLKIGDLHAKKNDKDEATKAYLQVAEFYGEQGFYLKAVAVYKQVLKLDPRLIEVNIKLAEVYRQLGLLSDAMQQYELVAAFYHREGKTKEALSTIRELVELDPENVATRIKLAELYSKESMTRDAISEFAKAADYLRSHARIDDFIKVAERLVWHQPDNHTINRELAGLYLKRNDPRHALQKLQACFKADPRDVETLSLLASAFLALDQKAKTVSVWKELARIYIENQQQAQAVEIHRRILTVAPDDPEAQAAAGARRAFGTGGLPVPPQGSPPSVFQTGSQAAVRIATPLGSEPGERRGVTTGSFQVPSIPPTPAAPPPPRIAEPVAPPQQQKRPMSQPAMGPSPGGRVATPIPSEARSEARVQAKGPAPASQARAPISLPPDSTAFDLEDEPEHTATKQQGKPRPASEHDFEMQVDDITGNGDEEMMLEGLDPAEAHADEIAKLLTETDVYIGYNLHEKAIDHLNRVFELDPKNLEAHERMKDVYITLGRVGDAAAAMAKLVELTAQANPEQARAYLREMVGADPARARALAQRLRLAIPAAEPTRPATPSPIAAQRAKQAEPDLEDDLGFDELEVERNTPVPIGVETSDIVVTSSAQSSGTLDFDMDDLAGSSGVSEGTQEIDPDQLAEVREESADDGVALAFEDGSVTSHSPGTGGRGSAHEAKTFDASLEDLDAIGARAPAQDFALDPGDQAFDESMGEAEIEVASPAPAREPSAPGTSGTGGTSLEDDLDEADFFVSQNLFSEAQAILSDLLGRYPNHPLVLAKLQDLEAQQEASSAPPAPPVAAAPAPSPSRVTVNTPLPVARKPAVIAKPLGEEDADTHYDSGLAYKEMGLHDEAVKEFMLVRDTPGRAVQCHLMIGLCHLERGKLSDAVSEFKIGLYVEGINDRESLALYFELGAAYEALRDAREALYYYEKVFKRDPRFREVDKRIQAVKAMAGGAGASGGQGQGPGQGQGKKNGSGTQGHEDDSIDAALDILSDAPSGDYTPG